MFKPYAANYGITRDDREIIFLSLSFFFFYRNYCNYTRYHRIIEAWNTDKFVMEDRIVEEIASTTIKEEKEY